MKVEVDIYKDHVFIEHTIVWRPHGMGVEQWLDWWERAIDTETKRCKYCVTVKERG